MEELESQLKQHTLVDQHADEITKDAELIRKQTRDILLNETTSSIERRSVVTNEQQNENSVITDTSDIELIKKVNNTNPILPLSTSITIPDPVKSNPVEVLSAQICSVFKGAAMRPMYTEQDLKIAMRVLERKSDYAGKIQKKPFIENEFQFSLSSKVTMIEHQDSKTCWIKCQGDNTIKLIDRTGNAYKVIAFDADKIRQFCIGTNDVLYVCSEGPNCIKQVTPEMNITTFCQTGKLLPQGIASSSSGDLFVTLVENSKFLKTDYRSKRILVKYGKDGREIARAEKDLFSNYLFRQPFCVRVSRSDETVAVLNNVSNDFSYLMQFDSNLNLKLRYLGNGETLNGNQQFMLKNFKRQFAINNLCFNSQGNMVISEWFSKSLQLLSTSCNIMATICNDVIEPSSLSIMADDELWVGYIDGRLKVWRI